MQHLSQKLPKALFTHMASRVQHNNQTTIYGKAAPSGFVSPSFLVEELNAFEMMFVSVQNTQNTIHHMCLLKPFTNPQHIVQIQRLDAKKIAGGCHQNALAKSRPWSCEPIPMTLGQGHKI